MKCFPILALIAVFLAGCSRDPNVRKQKFFASGQQYFQQGQYAEASIQFSNAIAADSGFAQAHYQLAQTYIKLGEEEPRLPGTQAYRRTAAGKLSRAHRSGQPVCAAGHDLASAQREVDLLQSKQPENPLVHLAVANLLAAQANLPGALQEAQKAVALAPHRSPSYLQLALLQLRANQSDAAEVSFKKAIELDSKDSNARLALGTMYASRNRMADAEQQFRQAIANDPANPDPRADLARLYLAQGKNAEAEAFLQKAKLDFPGNSVGYRMLGDFYFATGDLAKAAAEYDQLNRDHPGDWQVKSNHTQLLILTNRLQDARKADDEILKAYPSDSDALIFAARFRFGRAIPAAPSPYPDAVRSSHRKDWPVQYPSTASSPKLLGMMDTRKSIWCPWVVTLERPSCGTRRSAISSSDITLMREITCFAISTPDTSLTAFSTPSMRYLIFNPVACDSIWISLAPTLSAS